MQTSSLKIGTILRSSSQEYKIEKILGAGSFGITYLASSKVKHGNVTFTVKFAIKEHFMESCFRDANGVLVHCTPTSQRNVEQSRKDFINEAKRLQKICQYSRNIVHVNEAFEANGTAYYVMEYLDGGSPKPTDEKSAIVIIEQVAEAVSILHKNKLLHLDIKPDNIVLKSSENGDTYPVLIDFGITKHFDEKGNPTSSPNAKGISQGFAPIEQNDVIREFAPTLDIYALGATLLYLLTGKNPPSSIKLIDPSQRELRALIPSTVSPETRNAILRAMSPNKNDRPQSVNAFLNDLNCNNWDSSDKQENHTSKTKPINKGTKPLTEPIKKKKKHSDDSKTLEKWNVSYWATIVTLIISLISLWFVFPNIFFTGIICLVGLVIDFGLCHYISKWIKKNSGLLFTISFFVFFIICYVLKFFLPVYIVIAEIVLLMLFLLAFVQGKNITRWCISAALLGITCFFGYVWYSQNFLQNMYRESNDSNIIEQTEVSNSEDKGSVTEIKNINGHDCVDLGLSVNWATYNLGAGYFGVSPAVLGDLYAFGDLTPIDKESTNTSIQISEGRIMNKNITWLREHKIVNSNDNLTSQYDVATHEWGDKWRTPTIEEMKELFSKCKREPGKVDGQNGVWFTGPSGATIFLPAQGYRQHKDGKDGDDKIGYYLSSTVVDTNDTQCYGIYFKEDMYHVFCLSRNNGYLIRPVSNK